jgi:hypothetical protein
MVKRPDRTLTAIDGCFGFINFPDGEYTSSVSFPGANSFFIGLKLVVILLLFVVFSFVPLWQPLSSSLGQAAWASATTALVGTIPGEFSVNSYLAPIGINH